MIENHAEKTDVGNFISRGGSRVHRSPRRTKICWNEKNVMENKTIQRKSNETKNGYEIYIPKEMKTIKILPYTEKNRYAYFQHTLSHHFCA